MTDPQSWQREWARQLREENRWRRKALHRQPGELQARIAEKVPETVRDTLTAAFGAAFSAALAGEPLLRRTASPKAEARRLARAEEQLRTPERFSSVRGTGRSAVFSAAAASAVRGSGLGLLGIGLPDIPLFAASLLRSLGPVSYTHLDVYKRQGQEPYPGRGVRRGSGCRRVRRPCRHRCRQPGS